MANERDHPNRNISEAVSTTAGLKTNPPSIWATVAAIWRRVFSGGQEPSGGVSADEQTSNAPGASSLSSTGGDQRRRASRFPLKTPMVVAWQESDGGRKAAGGSTQNVNAFGALLVLNGCPSAGCAIKLTSLGTNTEAAARVVWSGTTATEGVYFLGVELDTPNPDFWPES